MKRSILKTLWKRYWAHTPEKRQKIGRIFLRVGLTISASGALMHYMYFAMIAAACAIIGDTIMDFSVTDDEKK